MSHEVLDSSLAEQYSNRVKVGLNGTPEARVVEKVYQELCDTDSSQDGLEILKRFNDGICFMNGDYEYFLTHRGFAYRMSYGSYNPETVDTSDFFRAYNETVKLNRGN